jgi:hypothetical protein
MRTLSKRQLSLQLVIAFGLVVLLLIPLTVRAQQVTQGPGEAHDRSLVFNQQMRKLWEDHVTWTRMVIVSFAAGLPDFDPAVNRLLQNQTDIGNAIKPFYGDEAGDRLTALLRDHILIAADLLVAAKAGDTGQIAAAQERWYANADEIATFLHEANPKSWPQGEMQAMMRRHLDLTLQEATARLSGDWQADIDAYEAVHLEILQMADMLSQRIVEQFPKRFR